MERWLPEGTYRVISLGDLGQLRLSQVSQVPQFSYPHRIHCPLTPPSSDSSPKAWTTEAARASLTTTGPPPAHGEEEQWSPWLPGQAWPLPTAGGVVGGGGRLLSSVSRPPPWAPILFLLFLPSRSILS